MSASSLRPHSAAHNTGPHSKPTRFALAARRAGMAAALCAASQAASAQMPSNLFFTDYFQGVPYASTGAYTPGISLYGVVDNAIGFTKGAQTAFVQQSGGEWTSKFGMYGVEDLGGGYRVRFALENGFDASNGSLGTSNTMFNREAWIALGSAKTGEVKFGLQDAVGVPLFIDVFGEVLSVSTVAYLAGWTYDLGPGASYQPLHISNAVSYSSPWYGPFNAQALIQMHSADSTAPTLTNRSIAVNYFDGHLFGTISYFGNYAVNGLNPSQYVRTDNISGGLLYDAGHYVLSAGYSFLAPRLEGDRVSSTYTLGAIYRYLKRNDFRAEVVYRTVGGWVDHSYGVTLGYDYNLSKRTALYVRGSVIHNIGTAPTYSHYPYPYTQQPTLDNVSNAYSTSNGTQFYKTPHVVLIGMYHKF
ncbi:porin [Paraburkholderia sp. J7]|uniref:porin n=1 Tax=Paraburkholderia sp. J7 TaxID=2805438 RepID=UPI002AB760BC|nr:porin [Paraburkholderia sp. J7]